MGLNYDKYINRLKARRAENPAYEAMRRATTAFAEPTMAANRQIQGSLSRAGGSIGARAQIQQSAQQQMLSGQQQIMNSIPVQDTTNIDNQIMNLEMARDQERDAQKDATLKSILEIGGTVLGAGVGLAAGNPMIGAQIGAGAGQMAGSFVGGGGKYGMNYMNREELMQGVGDTIAGISAAVSLGQQKKLLGDVQDKWEALKMDPDKMEMALAGIKSGNMDIVRSALDGLPSSDMMDSYQTGLDMAAIGQSAQNTFQNATPTLSHPLFKDGQNTDMPAIDQDQIRNNNELMILAPGADDIRFDDNAINTSGVRAIMEETRPLNLQNQKNKKVDADEETIPKEDTNIKELSDDKLDEVIDTSINQAATTGSATSTPAAATPAIKPDSFHVKVKAGDYTAHAGGNTRGKALGEFVSKENVLMQIIESGGKRTYARIKADGKDIPCNPGDAITVNADGSITIKRAGK